jgi:hypothetical protein
MQQTPDQYLAKATRARLQATLFHDPLIRDHLMVVAAQYEALAAMVGGLTWYSLEG